jgi:hypothetical protein
VTTAEDDSSVHSEKFDPEKRIPKLVETTSSPILVVQLRKALDSHEGAGNEVEIFMNSDSPAMFCRILANEVKGRKVVSFTADSSINRGPSEVPLGPIFDGFNWPTSLEAIEEFCVIYNDLDEYSDDMMAKDEVVVPKDFAVGSLKLMKLYNCTGDYSFPDNCLVPVAHLNLQALIFVESRRTTPEEEEQSLLSSMKACTALDTLCLNYNKAVPVSEEPTDEDENEEQQGESAQNVHHQANEEEEITPTYLSAASSKQDPNEEQFRIYCAFPLADLLSKCSATLTSLYLGADLTHHLHNADLSFIAALAAYFGRNRSYIWCRGQKNVWIDWSEEPLLLLAGTPRSYWLKVSRYHVTDIKTSKIINRDNEKRSVEKSLLAYSLMGTHPRNHPASLTLSFKRLQLK